MRNASLSFLLMTFMLRVGCSPDATTELPIDLNSTASSLHDSKYREHSGGLLLTDFHSLDEFKNVVRIEYLQGASDTAIENHGRKGVRLTHACDGGMVVSLLEEGISEGDFLKAKRGNIWVKIGTTVQSPFAIWHMSGLKAIESLGRRRPWEFGKGDVAFYDLAASMVSNILHEDKVKLSAEALGDKGYLNSFNHITAQAFMTSVFSEDVADFVADVHERHNMPELITGNFSAEQLADIENGPVDNYLDMINNEWGQELGKALKEKYQINSNTRWTPGLMADYLNDIQLYQGWAFRIGFSPFTTKDEIVVRFSSKINKVLNL